MLIIVPMIIVCSSVLAYLERILFVTAPSFHFSVYFCLMTLYRSISSVNCSNWSSPTRMTIHAIFTHSFPGVSPIGESPHDFRQYTPRTLANWRISGGLSPIHPQDSLQCTRGTFINWRKSMWTFSSTSSMLSRSAPLNLRILIEDAIFYQF